MTSTLGRHSIFGSAVLLSVLLLDTRVGHGQTGEQSPSEIIKFLTHQSGGLEKWSPHLFSCGTSEEDEKEVAAANSLVKLGVSALPEIERVFDSLQELGQGSQYASHSELILFAYARIRGSAAYSRLRLMADSPKLGFLEPVLD